MVNYASLAATAQRLIEANGRDVTLVKLSEVPADAAKPWRGTTDAPTEVTAKAVMRGYTKEEVDGDLIRRGDQEAIIAELSVPGQEIEEFELLRDDEDQEWRIMNVEKVRPGPLTLVFKAQLRL